MAYNINTRENHKQHLEIRVFNGNSKNNMKIRNMKKIQINSRFVKIKSTLTTLMKTKSLNQRETTLKTREKVELN